MKHITEFFEENPLAPEVIEVDGQLFLSGHYGAAQEFAQRIGAKVVEHKNPKLGAKAKADAVKQEEVKAKVDAEAKAKADADAKLKQDADAKAKADADAKK